ncbi:oxidoreductase [Aureococcus anophagefferens]|nr:oxidoreductase [Aureococcus anophagefferens]
MGSAPPTRAMSRLLCIAAFAAALQPQPRAPEPPRIEKTANYKAAAEASARLAGELKAPPASRTPEPPRIEKTANYKAAAEASARLAGELKAPPASRKTVAVVGGGLSGLACGKYLSDAGHEATVYEARDVLGGKVSAWQDDDGDWIETGLHVFFGAYPNVLNLFKELDIRDRLHSPEGVPAPLNMAAAILTNTEMLSLVDKIRMVPGLLPMLLEGQSFIDEQDELSVLQFMKKYGMPDTINEEIFIAMGKALDFIDPDKLSMTVVLTAMNRFINEADGSQTAFLDGNQPERVCAPMADRIRDAGGDVETDAPLAEIRVNDDGGVAALVLKDGREVVADEYVLAMPVDVTKRLIPEACVYADMSRSCAEYADDDRSMLELVFAPCAPEAGSPVNWLAKPDDDVVAATLDELKQLFPADMADAKLLKSAVVRTPRSVYAAIPGRNKYRPSQRTPIPNLTLAGCYTSQKFLGSMEGAVLAGKLAAEVVAARAVGAAAPGLKDVQRTVVAAAADAAPRRPTGCGKGDSAIAYGGGAVLAARGS